MIEFTWDIIYRCNYRCAYCWFDEKWDAWAKEYAAYPEAGRHGFGGQKITYGVVAPAAPSDGTWSRGDRVVNTAPAAGA